MSTSGRLSAASGSEPAHDAGERPRVLILDLTAAMGARALSSLLPAADTPSPWLGLPLAGMPGEPLLDWHRPASADRLPPPGAAYLGRYCLVGPGTAPLLPALLERLAGSEAGETGFLLAPTALIEGLQLRQLLPGALPGNASLTLQLPSGDPQALWMILLEQIGSLMRRHPHLLSSPSSTPIGEPGMSTNLKQCMDQAMSIEGAVAVALVDHRSGMCLAQAGGGLNLELAGAGNSEVVRAKLRTIEALGLRNSIEDILITLQHQYHLIRLIPANPGLFLYLALDRQRGNLALARYKLTEIERGLRV